SSTHRCTSKGILLITHHRRDGRRRQETRVIRVGFFVASNGGGPAGRIPATASAMRAPVSAPDRVVSGDRVRPFAYGEPNSAGAGRPAMMTVAWQAKSFARDAGRRRLGRRGEGARRRP